MIKEDRGSAGWRGAAGAADAFLDLAYRVAGGLGHEIDPRASRSGGTRAGWSEPGHCGHLRMFTARATTSTATTSEIASSAIIMSLDQGRIAETSVGLKAAAVVNDRCR